MFIRAKLTAGEMTLARHGHTSTLLPNKNVLVVGGTGDTRVELYDSSASNFRLANGKLLSPTQPPFHTATLLDEAGGTVLVAGGTYSRTADGQVYDATREEFTLVRYGMAYGRQGHSATLLPNGTVLIAGGGPLPVEGYDPSLAEFRSLGRDLTSERYLHTATLIPGKRKVLFAGGNDASYAPTSSAEVYDVDANSFQPAPSMTEARFQHTATALKSGMVLITGGNAGSRLSSAELYDPDTNTFAPTLGTMSCARSCHTATRLSDGRVLIAGGDDSFGFPLSSIEIYDPATQMFSPVASMIVPRSCHTATALEDGSILLAGGLSRYPNPRNLSSCEVLQILFLKIPKLDPRRYKLPSNISLLLGEHP